MRETELGCGLRPLQIARPPPRPSPRLSPPPLDTRDGSAARQVIDSLAAVRRANRSEPLFAPRRSLSASTCRDRCTADRFHYQPAGAIDQYQCLSLKNNATAIACRHGDGLPAGRLTATPISPPDSRTVVQPFISADKSNPYDGATSDAATTASTTNNGVTQQRLTAELVSFKLWLVTLSSTSIAIVFALIGSVFATINFVMTPKGTLSGPIGLVIWNSAQCK